MAKSRMWVAVLKNGKEFIVMAQTKEQAKEAIMKACKVRSVKSIK